MVLTMQAANYAVGILFNTLPTYMVVNGLVNYMLLPL